MPWNVAKEYEQFLRIVTGHQVLMGRRSFEEFGRDLQGCHSLVLTRGRQMVPGASRFACLEDALSAAQAKPGPLFCAGGAEVYWQTIGLASGMLLSFIKGRYSGNIFFPAIIDANWRRQVVVSCEDFETVFFGRVDDILSVDVVFDVMKPAEAG